MADSTYRLTEDAMGEHAAFVRGLARRLVFDDDVADDVVQQAWLATIEGKKPRGGASRAWLGAVVRNLVARVGRDNVRRERRETRAAQSEAVAAADDLVLKQRMLRRVVDSVLELDEPYRSTVLLRYYDDLTPSQIAGRLSVPAATVRSRLKRAHDMLRRRLDSSFGGDRQAWSLALLPWIAAGPAVGGGGTSTVSATAEGIPLSGAAGSGIAIVRLFLGAVILVSIGAVATWFATSDGDSGRLDGDAVSSEGVHRVASGPVRDGRGRAAIPIPETSSEGTGVAIATDERPITFDGFVTEDGGTRGLAGAAVRLYRQPEQTERSILALRYTRRWIPSVPLAETVSADDGSFSFRGMVDGCYYLIATLDGYALGFQGKVVVAAGVARDVSSLEMVEADRIAMRVENEIGEQIAGAEVFYRPVVRIGHAPEPFHVIRRITDHDGRCTFDATPDMVSVSVRRPGYRDFEYVNSKDTPGAAAHALEQVVLRRGRRLVVSLVPAGGLELPERVTLWVAFDGDTDSGIRLVTDETGEAILENAPQGDRVRVLLEEPGLGVALREGDDPYAHANSGREFAIAAKGESRVTVPIHRAALIRGRVIDRLTGRPVAGVLLEADPAGLQSLQVGAAHDRPTVESAADGSFELPGLAGAQMVIRVASHDWVYAPENWRELRSLTPFLDPTGYLPLVTAVPNGIVENVTVAVIRSATIEGRVVDGKGRPIKGVWAEPDRSLKGIKVGWSKARVIVRQRSVATDINGRFRLTGLLPGPSVVAHLICKAYPPSRTLPVAIRPGGVHSGVEIILKATPPVVIRLVDDLGRNIENVVVALAEASVDSQNLPQWKKTGSKGALYQFAPGGGRMRIVIDRNTLPPALRGRFDIDRIVERDLRGKVIKIVIPPDR